MPHGYLPTDAVLKLILLGRFSGAHQIPQCLVSRIRTPTALALRTDNFSPVLAHPADPFSRDPRLSPAPRWALPPRTWPPSSQLPVQRVACRPPHNKTAAPPLAPVSSPVSESILRDSVFPSDRISPPCSATATEIVSHGHPTPQFLFFSSTGSFRLWLCTCIFSDSQHNPRLRIAASHSIVTITGVRKKYFSCGRSFSWFPAHLIEQDCSGLQSTCWICAQLEPGCRESQLDD